MPKRVRSHLLLVNVFVGFNKRTEKLLQELDYTSPEHYQVLE
jgi:hypothetical protein